MLIFKKKEKIHKTKKSKTLDLKKKFIKNLAKIGRSHAKEDHRLVDLSNEVCGFFKEYYKIKYEFTLEELRKDINERKMNKSKKTKLKMLLSDLSKTVYSEEPVKKAEEFVKDLLDIIPKI